MKKTFFLTCILASTMIFTACKKEKETAVAKPEPDAETLTKVEDNNDAKSESDQASTDVTDAMNNFKSINGRIAVTNERKVICGCSIDSVGVKTIRLKYDGVTPCGNPSRTRSGTITFELIEGNQWKFPGSKVKVSLADYKVTKLSNQKSWTFNGTKYITNVNGHLKYLAFLAGTDSLLYRERAKDLKITLSGGGEIMHNIARTTTLKVVKYPNRDAIQFAGAGDTTLNGVATTESWGTNRFGNTYTNVFTNRFVSDSYCGFGRPRFGTFSHISNNKTVTLTFGVNESGASDTRDCAYGWKLNFQNTAGISGEKVFSY
jgi:hypothetical protein